ncbi:phage terminase large subunit [bacterium]|nr:phage terminase large subunit [bacterium]
MEVTPVFTRNRETTKKIVVNRGGTRSSKTYSIEQLAALWLITGECGKGNYIYKGVWSTVRKHSTTLDKTCIRDFEEVMYDNGWLDMVKHNKTKRTYSYLGRIVEFFGANDQQKIRGSKRNILHCNEANELGYKSEFFQLLIRTTDKVFLDFNPDDEDIWINAQIEKERAVKKGDVEVIVSTFEDNTFLDQSLVDEILYLKDTDPEFWKIYGLGQYGKIQGLIFPEIKVVEEIPSNAKLLGYGLDFGFTLDPTTIMELWQHDTDLYFNEFLYEKGLTNQDIIQECNDRGMDFTKELVCDSAEPKSIAEIKKGGIRAIPCTKGPDSINFGINTLKSFTLHTTARSLNARKEDRKYKWKTDINGDPVKNSKGKPVPMDANNHTWDARRYVAVSFLKLKKTGRYHISQF